MRCAVWILLGLFVAAAIALACYLVAFVRAHEAMGRAD